MRAFVKHAFYACQRRAARMRIPAAPSLTRLAVFNLHTIAKASSDMAVSETRLREQLAGLLDAGYRCLDLPAALEALTGRRPLAQPGFCLTFDDGYRSLYECGLRILEDLDLTATVFVTVNFIEGRVRPPWHSSDAALVREYTVNAAEFRPLDWNALRALLDSRRVRLGSHSLNHYLAGTLAPGDLRSEIYDSKHILEERLGVEALFFAYPYGVRLYDAYTERTEAMIHEAGYRCSCTSRISRAAIGAGPWLLPRLSLVEADTARDACAKAAGAYDWVALAQNGFHRIFPNPHTARPA
jgi:peptidoglycan/xylan/chitin deacetylase (PgdA/CDA1 family)